MATRHLKLRPVTNKTKPGLVSALLAQAIGYAPEDVAYYKGKDFTRVKRMGMRDSCVTHYYRYPVWICFDYRQTHVAWAVAAKYDLFPYHAAGAWRVVGPTEIFEADTPERAVAAAAIAPHMENELDSRVVVT